MHATMTHASGRHTVEGIARVVRVEGRVAWLEPEQTTSCGHCASSSSCGAKGIGTVGARLEARRFPMDNDDALRVGERIVVGVNKFTVDAEEHYEPLRVNPAIEAEQSERLAALRATRDNAEVTAALDELKRAAEGTDNCLPPMKRALAARATGGEVAGALRSVWGTYQPVDLM